MLAGLALNKDLAPFLEEVIEGARCVASHLPGFTLPKWRVTLIRSPWTQELRPPPPPAPAVPVSWAFLGIQVYVLWAPL